jgi:transcriptional regulator with PAS, ATPase and Fis domain
LSSTNDSTTLRPHSSVTGASIEQAVVLVVGSDRGCEVCQHGRLATVDGGLVVGRKPAGPPSESALVFSDPTMSHRHLIIRPTTAGEFELADLGSTNGTRVNGDLVTAATKVQDGAIICAGSHVMVFRMASASQIKTIRHELESPLGPVATVNPTFAATCEKMRLLAATPEDVLLLGETGVGKKVYARAIHGVSGRKGAFVAVDCAALRPELVETELFGNPGLIEQAQAGTLFLEEVDELDPRVQARLLRLTEERLIAPAGASPTRPIDVRIVAATSRTGRAGEPGGLRAELAARLGTDPIWIPPLREHVEDIGALALSLLGGGTKPFELAAFQALCLHAWPGNVRELRKTLAAAEALAQTSDRIGFEHLPSAISTASRVRSVTRRRPPRPPPTTEELEVLLKKFRGNVLRVSRELDRKPAVVYRWARRFGLVVKGFRPDRT